MNNCEKCTDNRPRIGRLAGVTRTMRLAIYEGEGVPTGSPQDLSGLTVVVRVLRDGTTDIFTPGFVIEGTDNNVVKFVWPAERQTVGDYTFDVTITDGSGNINRVDWHGPHGIRLVAHSYQVYGEDAVGEESNEEVGLIGFFTSNGVGMSAYEEWLAQGHTGTEADYIAWMQQPAREAASDAEAAMTVIQARADEDHATASSDHTTAESDHTRADEDHQFAFENRALAYEDHLRAEEDHTRAISDHTRAAQDHTSAVGDHMTAGQDHLRAEADHTTASTDHTRAESDHSTAASDHTTAASDHTKAVQDSTRAGSDHDIAVADHAQAASDHTRAESDHTTAAADHTTAAADHTQATADHAVMAGYDTRLTNVETDVTQLGQKAIGNKFIPNATNSAQAALQELYLTGLDSVETYYVSQFRTNASGKIRLYINKVSDDSTVAYSEYVASAGEIGNLVSYNSSGIKGYFVESLAGANTSATQDATTGVINQAMASSLNENPAIKAYLMESGNVAIANLVKYTSQSLTDAQKTQARTNIGAASNQDLIDGINDVESEIDKLQEVEGKVISNTDLVPSLELVQDGATLTPTGTISSSQYTSDYKVMSLELSGEDFITLYAVYGGTGWSLACGYDADGNFVKSYGTATTGGSPASLTIVPESNIKTIKVTIHKSHLSSYKLVGYTYGIALDMFAPAVNHRIYVSPTATGDNSLVGVLKALSADTSDTKPSEKHTYEIILQPGDYDMDCSDQLTELPRGVFVPPYTTIKGAGRGVTFLKYIYEGTNDTVMSEHSVLNMPYTSTLQDVTCIAENVRYTIHSDLAETGKSAENSEVVLRNVELIHNGITNGETPTTNNPSAWGGGTLSGQVRKFYNCKFVAAMYTPFANHDRNTNTSAQYFEFQNCEFEALRVNNSDLVTDYATPAVLLNSWGSGVPVFVNFVNCYANKWVGLHTTGNFDSDYQVKCDNELLFHIKENTANPQNKRHYITGGCREFVFTNSTTKGAPVVMENSRSARAANATDSHLLIYGVLIHDVEAGCVGVVMHSGMFAVQQIIGSSFSAGAAIGWNGSAWAVVGSNPIAVLLTDKIANLLL